MFSRAPQYSDFDVNGHVNNTKYIAWLCDALGFDALRGAYIGDLVAGYEKEIRGHDPLRVTLARNDDAFSFRLHPMRAKSILSRAALCGLRCKR